MNLSMISKSLLIALPMFALAACSSNSESDADSMETNKNAVEEATAEENTVETAVIEAVALTPEEELIDLYTMAILETTINFEFDKSTIAPRYTKILDAHSEFLIDNPMKSMVIEGHADEQGTPEYNIALGERRANSISTYLENMGVSADQLSVVSYGEEKPVNPGHDAAAQAENRRAELTPAELTY